MSEGRKVAAILVADIVGYSRLMGEDEAGTAQAVSEHREAARPMTFNGFVTFAHFTCQHRCALKGRTEENQSLGALDVGAKSTENGLFLASVTMPSKGSRS